MCPDYQILSVYVDGELPSPWKEKLEEHLNSCDACRSKVEELEKCAQLLKDSTPSDAAISAAQARVWKKLSASVDAPAYISTSSISSTENNKKDHVVIKKHIWRRSVSVPLPAAWAASAVLIFTLAFALSREAPVSNQNQEFIASRIVDSGRFMETGIIMDSEGLLQVSNMSDVLTYLGTQDEPEIVIMRLPETKNFSSFGEPTIINAADYSSTRSSRIR